MFSNTNSRPRIKVRPELVSDKSVTFIKDYKRRRAEKVIIA